MKSVLKSFTVVLPTKHEICSQGIILLKLLYDRFNLHITYQFTNVSVNYLKTDKKYYDNNNNKCQEVPPLLFKKSKFIFRK